MRIGPRLHPLGRRGGGGGDRRRAAVRGRRRPRAPCAGGRDALEALVASGACDEWGRGARSSGELGVPPRGESVPGRRRGAPARAPARADRRDARAARADDVGADARRLPHDDQSRSASTRWSSCARTSRRRASLERRAEPRPHGSRVAVAGMAVARQRPSTANGVVFMLLEDEHGQVNLIVPPPVYEALPGDRARRAAPPRARPFRAPRPERERPRRRAVGRSARSRRQVVGRGGRLRLVAAARASLRPPLTDLGRRARQPAVCAREPPARAVAGCFRARPASRSACNHPAAPAHNPQEATGMFRRPRGGGRGGQPAEPKAEPTPAAAGSIRRPRAQSVRSRRPARLTSPRRAPGSTRC